MLTKALFTGSFFVFEFIGILWDCGVDGSHKALKTPWHGFDSCWSHHFNVNLAQLVERSV